MKTLAWIMANFTVLALSMALAQGTAPGHEQHHGPGEDRGEIRPGMGMMMSQIESELDFLRHMIVHHQEAVDSARQVVEVAEREEIRTLADEIIEVQSREIEMMEGWLEAWYPGEAQEITYQPMMRSLEGLTPQEVERAFIEDMLMHHRMAVMDALQLLMHGLAEHEEVRALAQQIINEQTREIAEMQTWLRDWYGVTTPMGMMHQMPGHSMTDMHDMMQRCMALMGQMMGEHGMMSETPMHQMMSGMMASRYDQQTVEALARAFLAGHQPDAEIVQVEPPGHLYTVTFRHGDTQGRLIVDAATGEVRLETPGE